MIESILKNMNLFVDGRGYAGKIDEITTPKLTIKEEDYRAGGMDAPVALDMGMEKMEASFVLSAYDSDVIKLFGLAPGKLVKLEIKGALQSEDGEVKAASIKLRGTIKEMDSGTWKPGDKSTLNVGMSVRFYSYTIDDDDLIEVDAENMIRKIGGVDQLEEIRKALGM